MGAHMLNEQNHKIKEPAGKYCNVCTPNECICPSTWANSSNHIHNEETDEEEEEAEPEESDWDADLEEAQDYYAGLCPYEKTQADPQRCCNSNHIDPQLVGQLEYGLIYPLSQTWCQRISLWDKNMSKSVNIWTQSRGMFKQNPTQ